jgi:hypothetical protein
MPATACTALAATNPGLRQVRDDRRIKCNAAAVAVATALVLWVGAMPAQARSPRTFVSGTGSDASATCSRAAPCRSFAGAFSGTAACGEIVVLDSAGCGPVTIARAVNIVNDGVGTAGIRPDLGGVGITINAGASDVVNLRGLTIDAGSVDATGGDEGAQRAQVHRRMFQSVHESDTLTCIRHNYAWLPTVPGMKRS